MSDVSGAAASGGADAPLSPVMQTFGEAAAIRMASLKSDRAWGQKYLAGDVTARNEAKVLLALQHEQRSDADQAALASSIKLERVPSLVTAERQRADAEAADAAIRPDYGQFGRSLGPEELAKTHDELSSWAKDVGLSGSTARNILQHVADQGQKLASMSPEQQIAWGKDRDRILLGVAHSDPAKVAEWRAAAGRVVAGSKFTLKNSGTLQSAYAIRMLALAGGASK
jgi:hypothetical protein